MPEFYTIAILVLASLAMQITPGPDMMLVMGRGIGQGYRIAQATAVGIACAGFIQLPLLAFGVSELVAGSPWVLDAIRLIGAGYLIFLGLKLVRASKAKLPEIDIPITTFRRAILDGVIANLMNPKMIVFQLAFLPQFVDLQAGPVWSQLLILGFVMKASGFVVMSTIAATSGAAGRLLEQHPTWKVIQDKLVGVMMLGIGIRLLFGLGSGTNPSR